jgi:hypothetical protein
LGLGYLEHTIAMEGKSIFPYSLHYPVVGLMGE